MSMSTSQRHHVELVADELLGEPPRRMTGSLMLDCLFYRYLIAVRKAGAADDDEVPTGGGTSSMRTPCADAGRP